MKALKHSRQRDTIMTYLQGTKEHPTAAMIYHQVRETEPNISLGTVYRNLTLLESLGQIKKITIKSQPDRYDYRTDSHYHFCCRNCGRVMDLDIEPITKLNKAANKDFDGIIEEHDCVFYGTCPDCLRTGSESGID